jgi:hypothetical protein
MLLTNACIITDRLCWYSEDNKSLSASSIGAWYLISFVLLLIALVYHVNRYRVLLARCDPGTG